jgi:hypothetical protein
MRSAHAFGFGMVAMLAGAGSWLGCSATTSPASVATDAGSAAPDSGPAPDADAGDTDADDGAAPSTDDGGAQPSCDEYCKSMMTSCTGTLGDDAGTAQYASTEGCLNLCGAIGGGSPGDTTGDSIYCRLSHAAAAKTDPRTQCAKAGSTGGGACNDDSDAGDHGRCAAFCNRAVALCTQANGVDPIPFADFDGCMSSCGKNFAFDPTQPELTEMGNTLNCRQYHLVLAYESTDGGSPAVYHCPHLAFPASAFCR